MAKLKEGWDCPFAYVLCSLADQVSAVAVEQILGRVLRMPKARIKRRDALNQSYAFIVSKSFDETAQQLKNGLVDGAGFNRLEAETLIAPQHNLGFAEAAAQQRFESDPLPQDNVSPEVFSDAINRLPPSVRSRVSFDPEKRTLAYTGPMSRESRNILHLGLATVPNVGRTIDRLYARSNNFQTSAAVEDDKPPFIVPLLAFRNQGELELFSKEHFLDLPWRLDECDPSPITERFKIIDRSQTGNIDVTDKGKMEISFVRNLQGQLNGIVREPVWTTARLANWLDSGIHHPDITKPSAIVFISKALDALISAETPLEVVSANRVGSHFVLMHQ